MFSLLLALMMALPVSPAPFPLPPFAKHFASGAHLQATITAAIAKGAPSVTIPAGDYAFTQEGACGDIRPGASLLLANASNFTLTGAGVGQTNLWFAPGYGVDVEGCTNLTLQNFAVDTLVPTAAQGQLLHLDLIKQQVTVKIEEGFPLPTDPSLFNQTCSDGSAGFCGEIKCVFWDKTTRRILQSQQMNNPMQGVTCSNSTRICVADLSVLDTTWSNPPLPSETLVTFSPRLWASKWAVPTFYRGMMSIYNTTLSTFQDINVHSSAEMVWVETLGGGGNEYRRLRVVRRDLATAPYPPRLLAANDDAFHSMSVQKGPLLEDSEFSFLADDFINIHNRLLPLAKITATAPTHPISGTRTLGVAYILDVGVAPMHGFCGETNNRNTHISHTMAFVASGDVLKLYAVSTKGVLLGGDNALPVAILSVESNEGLVTKNVVATLPKLPALIQSRVEPDSLAFFKLTVAFTNDSVTHLPLAGAGYRFLVQIDKFAGAGTIIRNNHFHDSYNNVGRFAANLTFGPNNLIERANMGIHISDDIASYNFLEGSLGVRNVTVVGNKFVSVMGGCDGGVEGAKGCGTHVCTNMTCILSHVDLAFVDQVHASGNEVTK